MMRTPPPLARHTAIRDVHPLRQSSPVHAGLADDPARALDERFAAYVLGVDPRAGRER